MNMNINMNKNSILIFFFSSLGFLCAFKNRKKIKYGEEIPTIDDPHLMLQFGGPSYKDRIP